MANNFMRQPEKMRNETDFVTVVSVGAHQTMNSENFVTVLSIGTGEKSDAKPETATSGGTQGNSDVHPEEEVEVFRLPGEPLGFGLKFEGGAKNAEKVKRLFVQSCAEQSPASRAKCSWGTIGEGDEVMSIDGVPVSQMSRLDCVRRLKESQLVIKLLVRCRGALRPEVVSAERKTFADSAETVEKKVPPELPSVPPPVPPRKLRHARGAGDGEANPVPAKKIWNGGSPLSSGTSSQTDSPQSQHGTGPRNGKNGNEESSSTKSPRGSPGESTKRSPEFAKSKQEPPEAMVYLDARSQDGSSTHGSTSDDTGSSMSTVIDRFSTSDRFSTVSTASTTSGGGNELGGPNDRSNDEPIEADSAEITRPLFDHLDQDFLTNPSEYLLKRLANSEALTHVESRGEAGNVIEKITAVVAPNTVLIEETLTLQPPLSFQDAPLSYGHETRPGLVYTADLAADSTTHFRPIRDEAAIVESVNCDSTSRNSRSYEISPEAPTLPARNHVNRIPVNQQKNSSTTEPKVETHHSREVPLPRESVDRSAPILPPKPLPRKDVKLKRKRPPPPPPPPPSTATAEAPPPVPIRTLTEPKILADVSIVEITNSADARTPERSSRPNNDRLALNGSMKELIGAFENDETISGEDSNDSSSLDSPIRNDSTGRTNKVLEIIEMKRIKAIGEMTIAKSATKIGAERDNSATVNGTSVVPAPREKRKSSLDRLRREVTISTDIEDSEESSSSDIWLEAKERPDSDDNSNANSATPNGLHVLDNIDPENLTSPNEVPPTNDDDDDDDDDETYRSLDEIREDFKNTEINGTLSESDEEQDEVLEGSGDAEIEADSTSDDSEDNGDDYYWQSNLATIGEEEETCSSLEYTNANKDVNNSEEKQSPCLRVELKIETARGCASEISETMKNGTIGDVTKPECVRRITKETASELDNKLGNQVNGRMENCGGDQRLPPDGDEFPATYQEFSACTSEQYQYVGSSTTRVLSRCTNGNAINPKIVGCDDIIDEKSSSSLKSSKMCKTFVTEKTSNDSSKTLRIESTTMKNSNNNNNNNVTSSEKSFVKTTSLKNPTIDNRSTLSQYTSVKREIVSQPEIADREKLETERSTYTTNCRRDKSEFPVVLTEKTFEISGYYPKETRTQYEAKDSHSKETKSGQDNSEIVMTLENNDSEYPDSPPPPLPLTGPPKIENATRTIDKPVEIGGNRKYSLNSESWRQDDKSEKSVRDKIAMFSSQSSLESPLFPGQNSPTSTIIASSTVRKLSKYKSSDDVFNDDKHDDCIERTRSFVDLTDSSKFTTNDPTNSDDNYNERAPSLPKTLPPDEPIFSTNYAKSTVSSLINLKATSHQTNFGNSTNNREFQDSNDSTKLNVSIGSPKQTLRSKSEDSSSTSQKIIFPLDTNNFNPRYSSTSLTRATSFSGENTYGNDLSQTGNSNSSTNGQISRTNSLASTFRRNTDDMRRQSLNQLIEQRRKGISKLRGLVIPEKNTVPVDKPIIDLPEIKSRDSILLHQLPRASIQDKWGSQSSLASNASTASLPMKATTSFKMPAPQIMSKYSPAFKRKSLAVYGTTSGSGSGGSTPLPSTQRASPTSSNSGMIGDAPKSLESICSPTRSDYSFEYVSSSSVSPETMRNRSSRPSNQRAKMNRVDYDDSDNDSAVSSSQSSISRGFSPPGSPAPSERSSLSSERSYQTSLIMDVPAGRNYAREIRPERMANHHHNHHHHQPNQLTARTNLFETGYSTPERSSSGSSSGGASPNNPRSPQPEPNPRNSLIPQRQSLKRSSSTETNSSSASSSTLTSGSQASAESLSRRVLKPQSVEAINRKNILASARCRSGRDHNGSPLIQRKFSDDEEQLPISGLARDNGRANRANGDSLDRQDVKIAYIEVTETLEAKDRAMTISEIAESIVDTGVIETTGKSTNDLMEVSNDLKMWVRSEAKALMADGPKSRSEKFDKPPRDSESANTVRTSRGRTSSIVDEANESVVDSRNKSISETRNESVESYKLQTTSRFNDDKCAINEDLLTTLTTKSRSRAPINLEDRSFGRSSRQMSLEDILVGKSDEKNSSVSTSVESSKNGQASVSTVSKMAPSALPRNMNPGRHMDESFVSKIPTPGRIPKSPEIDETARIAERSRISKIPTQRTNLGRRSASVTDMKKALERNESGPNSVTPRTTNQSPGSVGVHQRFSSLDSSVEEKSRLGGHEGEPTNGDFGSISSLASSTSLISQQELAQLVEDASSLEDSRANHEVIVVLLHKENPHGSVGITLAGGVDCETKEITVHRVLSHSIADKDGRVQRGDRILSINGRSTRGLSHRESLAVLKQPRSEIVLVVSRSRSEEGPKLRTRTESVETIVEGSETCGAMDDTAWGPATRVTIFKDGAGLGFSLAGGRDSPLGDRPLVIKKIFTGGAAEKTAALTAGDQLIEVNGVDVTRMTRIEAWSLMKKLSDGEANLLVRHPATKSS